jgi:hypothetical protein
MKLWNVFTLALAIGLSSTAKAQFATDFTAADCAGTSHNLFAELNAGKVVVLTWVMPCASCVGPAQTASNTVRNLNNPQVVFYMSDDYANTSCTTLASWAQSNSIQPTATFSSAQIRMTDYGSTGMPKTVVLGGAAHRVFLNVNNSLNASALTTAINQALQSNSTADLVEKAFYTYPNPAQNEIKLVMVDPSLNQEEILIYSTAGQLIKKVKASNAFTNIPSINVSELQNGLYIIQIGKHTQVLSVARD